MNLLYEFTMRFALKYPLHELASGPSGRRLVYSGQEGIIDGDHLKAKMTTGLGTAVIGLDGWGRFEIRSHFVTDDGIGIYVTFDAWAHADEETLRAQISGKGVDIDEQKLAIVVRLETGGASYSWVNHAVFIGEGRFISGGVEYKVYRLT